MAKIVFNDNLNQPVKISSFIERIEAKRKMLEVLVPVNAFEDIADLSWIFDLDIKSIQLYDDNLENLMAEFSNGFSLVLLQRVLFLSASLDGGNRGEEYILQFLTND